MIKWLPRFLKKSPTADITLTARYDLAGEAGTVFGYGACT